MQEDISYLRTAIGLTYTDNSVIDGLATSYDVLQAQNQLETSRQAELQAKVNLRIAVADVHFLEGTSLQL